MSDDRTPVEVDRQPKAVAQVVVHLLDNGHVVANLSAQDSSKVDPDTIIRMCGWATCLLTGKVLEKANRPGVLVAPPGMTFPVPAGRGSP